MPVQCRITFNYVSVISTGYLLHLMHYCNFAYLIILSLHSTILFFPAVGIRWNVLSRNQELLMLWGLW